MTMKFPRSFLSWPPALTGPRWGGANPYGPLSCHPHPAARARLCGRPEGGRGPCPGGASSRGTRGPLSPGQLCRAPETAWRGGRGDAPWAGGEGPARAGRAGDAGHPACRGQGAFGPRAEVLGEGVSAASARVLQRRTVEAREGRWSPRRQPRRLELLSGRGTGPGGGQEGSGGRGRAADAPHVGQRAGPAGPPHTPPARVQAPLAEEAARPRPCVRKSLPTETQTDQPTL